MTKSGKKEGEVNIVGLNIAKQKPSWAVEVKWSDRYYESPVDLASLKHFMETNKMEEAIVTSISKSGPVKYGDLTYQFIPVACYAYTVGYNTLLQMKENFGL